ncbi:restriction endonuclease subunit S [Salmonella enterica subsp. enterica serovar Lerum]|nr:restriction endonuclease subunit S [Salmonella enterica subsp. enterica serovar Lerum]EED6910596.1 restriction endonuclease subunit S [Salmonella enterica subsp. enterica serovar Lerum]
MSGGKVPEGWVQAVLGDYLYLKNGFAFKSTEYVTPGAHSYPVIRISDLDGTCATDSSAVHVLQGAEGFTVEKGDLLIAMSGATTGKIGIYAGNIPAYQNQRVGNIKLRSSKYGDEKYRNYLITSASKTILDEAYGGAQPNISGKSIEALSFHLAPLAEQKIIAEKLDTLLAQVDSTKARLEQIPQILKRFRQAVLTAAVNGLLTEAWRNKVQEPLNLKKINFELILAELRNGLSSKPNEKGLGHPILRISSVRSGHVDQSDIRYLECSEAELERHKLEEGDLLFTRYNGSLEFVGVCGLLKKTQYKDLLYPDKLIRARLTKDALPEYIEIFFSSPAARNAMMECVKTTSGQKGISGKDIKSQLVSLPSLKEQAEIVRRVEQLFAWADTIEKQVNNALTRVNSLTQSILAKAFRGELTAQWRAENPSLISGENSAAALLEKIKAERAASGGKKNSRKKA